MADYAGVVSVALVVPGFRRCHPAGALGFTKRRGRSTQEGYGQDDLPSGLDRVNNDPVGATPASTETYQVGLLVGLATVRSA